MLKKATLTKPILEPRYSSPLRTKSGETLNSRGGVVCSWIQQNCVYGEGDWYGKPVVLRDWQKRFIWRLYEYYPDGRRRYRRALWGVGKGNGKTPIAAWIGAYELLGGTKTSPRVIIGAASLKQANLVFGDLKTCMKESPTLSPLAETYDLQVLIKGRPGVAERIAAEAGSNDGARCTAFIADELHEWEGRIARVYLIVDGAVAKRTGAFTLAISTAGYDTESLLYSLYQHGKDVASGGEVDDEFLFEWYEAPEAVNLEDEDEWLNAIHQANPAAGDFNDIDSLRHRFQTMPRFEFERYHLNRWTSAYNAWIDMEKWDQGDSKVDINDGDTCYLSFHGTAERDSAAVVAVFPKDGKFYVTLELFEPKQGEVWDPDLIEEHIRQMCRRYYVRMVLYTPGLFSRSGLQLLQEGWPLEEAPLSVQRFTSASQALFDAAIEGRIVHGGDKTLKKHAEAAVAKDTGGGWKLDPRNSRESIAGVVALAKGIYQAIQDEATSGEPGILVF